MGMLPFKYGRRKCIFCQRQPPEVIITKEHLFADWLREIFPRTSETTHTLGIIEWDGRPGRVPPRGGTKEGQGHSGSKKIRHVCKACNETWLSNDIEKPAKPILIPLLNGEPMMLNPNMQQILAAWAAKTVMTAEYVHPPKVVIHQDERTIFKENLMPPIGWNVWIGTYEELAWSELAIQQYAGKLRIPTVDNGNPAEHNLIMTIIVMRRLVFVIVSSSWPRMWSIIGNPNLLCLLPIWPISSEHVSWPPAIALSDAILDQMGWAYMDEISRQPV